MSDVSAPISPQPIATDFSLKAAAKKYGISSERQFFPVNSLRLLYFLIVDFYTDGDSASREKVEQLIPKVEAVLAARSKHRAEGGEKNPESDLFAAIGPLQEVYGVIDTAGVRRSFQNFFCSLFPLQDTIFICLSQRMNNGENLTSSDLVELLKVRSMDCVLFATLINEIIQEFLRGKGNEASSNKKLAELPLSLDHHLSLIYQVNDLVDSIVFAKNDLDAGNFSPFQIIRKVAPEANQAKEMIKEMLSLFNKQTSIFPFSGPLQAQYLTFCQDLTAVVYPK
jgi:hypothetical protein